MKIKSTKTNISEENLFRGYSRRKLYCLSKTYEELARLYRSGSDFDELGEMAFDRKDLLYLKRLDETKEVFANQLDDVSEAFADVADTVVRLSLPLEHRRKALIGILKKYGITVREILFLEGEGVGDMGGNRISIEARTSGKDTVSSAMLGSILSSFFNRSLVPSEGCAACVYRGYDIFIYEDKPKYTLLSSVSRAVREDEKISGDNFSLEEYNQSQATMMISDGMGSGRKACRDSQTVIEFMEKFLEAGFGMEKSFAMVGRAVAGQNEDFGMTTLDACTINLMTGEAEFMKAGAAASFIKRSKGVDKIAIDTLPLGSSPNICAISQVTRLCDSDMLIMVSDGIVDAIDSDGIITLEQLISKSEALVPNELTDLILRYAISSQKGRIRDDMTVLACRICSKS
jgi:stage II sporulation protein E